MLLLEKLQAELRCAITLAVPKDPVVTPRGIIYSREALREHLQNERLCPSSRTTLHESDLTSPLWLVQACDAVHEDRSSEEERQERPSSLTRAINGLEQRRFLGCLRLMQKRSLQAEGVSLIGSAAFRLSVLAPIIADFYKWCEEQCLAPAAAWEQSWSHPESYAARHFVPRDLDLLCEPVVDVDALLKSVTEALPYATLRRKTVRSRGYEQRVDLVRAELVVPWIAHLGARRSLYIDLLKGQPSDLYCNLYKCLRFSQAPHLGRRLELLARYRSDAWAPTLIDGLTRLARAGVCVTPVLSFDSQRVFFAGKPEDVIIAVRMYWMRLVKEVEGPWRFLNISARSAPRSPTAHDLYFERTYTADPLATAVFTYDGEGAIVSLDTALELTPPAELRRGMLRIHDAGDSLLRLNKYIFLCCEPDYMQHEAEHSDNIRLLATGL